MTSQLSEIYNSLSEMDVTLNSEVVKVKKPSELPSSINTAILPIRLLTPIQQFNPQLGESSTWNAFGNNVVQVNWFITDMFLYDAVNQTIGIRALSDPLVDYCAAYLDTLNSGVLDLPVSTMLRSYNFVPDIINYPLGGQNFYYGVYVYLNFLEKY